MNLSFRPINWNALRNFYRICQYPTLTEAAKDLGLTQSCLSRRLAKLEDSLGYRVFNRRGPQGIKLLKEGRELRDLISPFYQNLAEYDARRQVHGFTFTTGKEQPSSRLPLSYTSEAKTPLSMHPQKTQVNSMALSKVMTTVVLLSSLFLQACQDVYNDKAQGLHLYEDPLIEKSDLTPTNRIPQIHKSQDKTQITYSIAAKVGDEVGKSSAPTEAVWGEGREFSYEGNSFGHLIWRKKNHSVF